MNHFRKSLCLSLLLLIVAITTETKICIYIGILLVVCEILVHIIDMIYMSILTSRMGNEEVKRIFNRAQDALDEILNASDQNTKHYPFSIQIDAKSIIAEEIEKCEIFIKECKEEYEDSRDLIIYPKYDKENAILEYLKEDRTTIIEWMWKEADKEPEVKYYYKKEEID